MSMDHRYLDMDLDQLTMNDLERLRQTKGIPVP